VWVWSFPELEWFREFAFIHIDTKTWSVVHNVTATVEFNLFGEHAAVGVVG
jgi:hypothetical protein